MPSVGKTVTRPKWNVILLIPLALSAFTHLWNPVGFPDIFYDEGIYMRRAMHVMEGQGLQEGVFYDHPYFGQIFLASALSLVGYPGFLDPGADAGSIAALYAAPRVAMGLLAIADTFLIFKIVEHRYGRRVALIAAILFSVMPLTWLLRRIVLDSILLPFLLASVLSAMYAGNAIGRKKTALVLLAGIFLGIAIFTKIPIFTMIPLVGYLVYSSSSADNRLRMLGLWFIPVILIPLIWPAYAASTGEIDFWLRDLLWQTQREGVGFWHIAEIFFSFDPVLLVLGMAGFIYAALRKQFFILLWIVPFVLFLSVIAYVQYFHWIPTLPVFCIAAALLIDRLAAIKSMLPYAAIAGLGTFGLVSTTLVITTDVTSAQFEAASFVANYANKNDVAVAANPVYSWIFIHVFDLEHIFMDYRDLLFLSVTTERLVLISDNNFRANIGGGQQLLDAYNNTTTIAVFEGKVKNYDLRSYPYTNMYANYEGERIEIRIRN